MHPNVVLCMAASTKPPKVHRMEFKALGSLHEVILQLPHKFLSDACF
jgi:hypothetical protein